MVIALIAAGPGCGGGGGKTGTNRLGTSSLAQRTPNATPAPTHGLSAVASTCKGFVEHVNPVLARGLAAYSATGDVALFGEFDGLSRRLGGIDVPAKHRAGLATMIAELSRAAAAVQTPRSGPPALSPPRQMVVVKQALARYDAAARMLGVRDCVITYDVVAQ